MRPGLSGRTVRVIRLEPGPVEPLGTLLSALRLKPHAHLRELDEATLAGALGRRVGRALDDPLSAVLAARTGDRLAGLAVVRKMPWDGEIFGFGCARLEYLVAAGEHEEALRAKAALLGGVLDHCGAEGVVNLHARPDLQDLSSVHALEASGFRLIVVLVRYYRRADLPIPRWADSSGIRPCRPEDADELREIARSAFEWNRFTLDPRFPRDRVGELYARWFENACRGKVSDRVVVAEREGRIAGSLVYGLEEGLNRDLPLRLGSFRIAAIRPAARGQGIYAALTEAALDWFAERADLLEGIMALSNEAIIGAMAKYGFRYRTAEADFHCWLA